MSYQATVTRLGLRAIFDLKGRADAVADQCGEALPAFPDAPNLRTIRDGASLCHIGPEHWLLLAPIDQEETLETALSPSRCPADISIVTVSDTLTFFHISGPDAPDVMSVATPLDLHPSVFAPNAVSFTTAFHQKALVLRVEDGFELAVEQSFGDMFEDYFSRVLA